MPITRSPQRCSRTHRRCAMPSPAKSSALRKAKLGFRSTPSVYGCSRSRDARAQTHNNTKTTQRPDKTTKNAKHQRRHRRPEVWTCYARTRDYVLVTGAVPTNATGTATSERARRERATSKRETSERATSERATSDRATSERATSERATSERATSERATSERGGAAAQRSFVPFVP